MSAVEELVTRAANDRGGFLGQPIEIKEHVLEPWEKRCHALADVLDFHKIVNTEEKRRAVEALGSEVINHLSYYQRWIVAFSILLYEKQILTPEEFARKMDDVRERWMHEDAQ
jgi:Nitrile hydratase beta subunit